MPEVTAVIVNYRTPELTKGAVRSCLTEAEVEEVIVIDNGSGDESADILTEEFRGQGVKVLENETNVGFATANNKGISKARTEFVFLLNSDAFVVPGAIDLLVRRLREDSEVGIIGPEIMESDGSTLQPDNYGAYPTVKGIFTRARWKGSPESPEWISGVAMMFRREFIQQIEGFDDRFFMYFEDVDLCRRVSEAGKRITREPRAKVVHFGGKSLSSDFKRKKMYYASQDKYLELIDESPFGRAMVRTTRWPVYALKTFWEG